MKRFLIILSDKSCVGRGIRGMSLCWFLRTFLGSREVDVVTPDELLDHRFRHAETVFLGVPTRVQQQHLARLNYRDLVLFDYLDAPQAVWEYSDGDFLLRLTDRYWKSAIGPDWSARLKWACLPLRRSARLTLLLRQQATTRRLFSPPSDEYDVGFRGYPNSLHKVGADGGLDYYRQRLEWMLELAERVPPLAFCGGLVMNSAWQSVIDEYGARLAGMISQKRTPFARYFRELQRCKVVLTPAGVARWTYRHYEAVYTGAVQVSTDLSDTQLLVPLPKDNLVLVPDHAKVYPYVEAGLNRGKAERIAAAQRSIAELEQYFHYGTYHHKKPLVFERFLQQLKLDRPSGSVHHPDSNSSSAA